MRAAFLSVAGAIALGGCVSTNPSPQRPGELRDVAQDQSGNVLRTTPDYAIKDVLAQPIDEAFAAMLLAYQKLGIQTATNDEANHRLGNTAVTVVHQFHGEDVSRFFECGRDAFGTPRADRYTITFAVITTLAPDGRGSTNVETLVTARGRDPGGASDLYCSTTGHLEAELIKAAR